MALAAWDRKFKLWSYAFSYSRLLYRSEPEFDGDLRVDLVFEHVRTMNVPAFISPLSIEKADFEENREALHITETPTQNFNLYILNGGPYYVLALHCNWHEDHKWLDAPSHFGPFRGVD